MDTSPMICIANQWTGFYLIGATVMKELIKAVSFSQNCRNWLLLFPEEYYLNEDFEGLYSCFHTNVVNKHTLPTSSVL